MFFMALINSTNLTLLQPPLLRWSVCPSSCHSSRWWSVLQLHLTGWSSGRPATRAVTSCCATWRLHATLHAMRTATLPMHRRSYKVNTRRVHQILPKTGVTCSFKNKWINKIHLCVCSLGFQCDDDLLEVFKTDFQLRLLWGSRGATVNQSDRYNKFNLILTALSRKLEPPSTTPTIIWLLLHEHSRTEKTGSD